MRKILFIVLIFTIWFNYVNADSNYESDYTLIDCINWENNSWVAFDSTKPFATLKVWIEKTIAYINSNVNFVWNESNANWKIFNVKVNCSFNDLLNPSINLNFLWENFKNELIIEWIWENSLIFKDVSFYLSTNAWNITFKNAIFLNENNPYFSDDLFLSNKKSYATPFSFWIKIIDSYVKLKNWNNIWLYWTYRIPRYFNKNWNIDYNYYNNFTNKQIIENSIIDIEVSGDYTFKMPVFLKNSKINFSNSGSNSVYNITFLEDWNTNVQNELNYSVFVSNEIDMWWNNLSVENTTSISFLNNKFVNFYNFVLWENTIYVNNFFDNNFSIDISSFKNLFNNVFKTWFTDTYDINNYRKNYFENNIWNLWLWWVYKRIRTSKYFNIELDSSSLYKEITGNDLIKWLWDIYVIFNY